MTEDVTSGTSAPRATVTFRIRDKVHKELKQRAAVEGTSLSEQIEWALGSHLKLVGGAAEGRQTSQLISLLVDAILDVDRHLGGAWTSERVKALAMRNAILQVLDLYLPALRPDEAYSPELTGANAVWLGLSARQEALRAMRARTERTKLDFGASTKDIDLVEIWERTLATRLAGEGKPLPESDAK